MKWYHPLDKWAYTAHLWLCKKCPFIYCVTACLVVVYGLAIAVVGSFSFLAFLMKGF